LWKDLLHIELQRAAGEQGGQAVSEDPALQLHRAVIRGRILRQQLPDAGDLPELVAQDIGLPLHVPVTHPGGPLHVQE
jgi:hypothetical protein